MSQKRIGLIVILVTPAAFLLLTVLAYSVLSPLLSCGYSAEQEALARALFDRDLLPEQIDTVRVRLDYNQDEFELSDEEVSTLLSMTYQNQSRSSNRISGRFPTLEIQDADGTVCEFEFYGQDQYVYLGASCLRYEEGGWSIGAGKVYDWLVLARD